MLGAVLGDGRGSRLYQQVVDRARLAQPDHVGAYDVDLAHAPAPLIVTATARDGVGADALEAAVAELLDDVCHGVTPITSEELDRAKALLATAWWRQMSTVAGRADALGRYATQLGDPARVGERLPSWESVSVGEVMDVAARVLREDARVTLSYLPEEPAGGDQDVRASVGEPAGGEPT
jgi:predicted Zn-dependent peptidase